VLPTADRRHDRYLSLRALHDVSTLDRVRKCSRYRINGANGVPIVVNSGVAHYSNLQRCASIWSCPVCSAKIRSARAEQIKTGIVNHYADGGRAFMITLTVRHHQGQRLAPLVDVVSGGWSHLLSGAEWKAQKGFYGIVGQIRSLEVTHGGNGWHPHLHCLVFLDGERDWEHRADGLAAELEARWIRYAERAGLDRPLEGVAADVQLIHRPADAAAYVAKVQDLADGPIGISLEMTRHDLKEARRHGRTPFQVLRDFRETGEVGDLAIWREYERATFRRQAITWSAGLRTALRVDDDRTDLEIAEEEVGGDVLAVVPAFTWRLVCRRRDAIPALLRAAETGGVAGVLEALVTHGIPACLDPPPPRPG
jgi:hypothetical protein